MKCVTFIDIEFRYQISISDSDKEKGGDEAGRQNTKEALLGVYSNTHSAPCKRTSYLRGLDA